MSCKHIIVFFVLGLISFGTVLAEAKDGENLVLAAETGTDFVIVIPEEAGKTEQKAAKEFQRLLAICSTIEVPIVTDTQNDTGFEIVIGNSNRGLPQLAGDLQADGFTIQTDKNKLFIQGGTGKGCLYGVYTFFEKYFGFRCYSPSVFKYPSLKSVTVPVDLRDTQIPVNVYRNVYYEVAQDSFYADWHKLNHMKPDWGLFVHTFETLVPVEKYYAEHPEYFALIDGKRVAKQADEHLPAQLCLTNPDVLQVVIENLGQMIQENPDALYWSVSQGDTYADQPYNCTCDNCMALDAESNSLSGSIITFVNKVAQHFPDKMISTLAYRYSRSAPQAVKPAPNVNIMLCTIECDRNSPIANTTASEAFCSDFEDWSKLTHNILMWDYVIQFSNLMAPFPNLRVLQPNMQYFAAHGVNAHFQQGNISKGGEYCELRPYLIAKLLWDPDMDFQAVMTDFLEGYYEEAAPFVGKYIQLTHDELEKSGLKLTIYGNPADHSDDGFLRAELMEQYDVIFDEAEKAVKNKPDVLERLQIARLPLIYSLFEIAKRNGVKETRVFENTNGKTQVRPEAMEKLDQFRKLCNKTRVQHLREGGLTSDEYCEQVKQFLSHTANQ